MSEWHLAGGRDYEYLCKCSTDRHGSNYPQMSLDDAIARFNRLEALARRVYEAPWMPSPEWRKQWLDDYEAAVK